MCRENKNKSLIQNFIFQWAYQILNILLPLVTTPYIARVLGPENSGIYSYTFSIVSYFVTLAQLGIEIYGNRSIAQVRNQSRGEISKKFFEIFYIHLIVGIATIVAYGVYIFYIAEQEYRIYYLIQGLFVLGAVLDINWFFFGIEEFKLTVTRNFVIRLMSVAFMFLLVKATTDLWIYLLILAGGNLLSSIVVWPFLPRYVSFSKVSLLSTFKHFKPLIMLFAAVVATNLYRMISKTILGYSGEINSLGCFEYADKIIRIPVTLITALGTIMLPRMASTYKSRNIELAHKYLNYSADFVFIMSSALSFGLMAIADDFVSFFLGQGYEATATYIMVMAITIIFMGWNNLVRTQILIPLEKDGVYLCAVWIGAIVSIATNIILIELFGALGASVSTLIAYLAVGLSQTVPLRNDVKILPLVKKSIFPVIAGTLMFVIIEFIDLNTVDSIISLTSQIIIGSICYLMLIFIYLYKSRNDLLRVLFKKCGLKGNK